MGGKGSGKDNNLCQLMLLTFAPNSKLSDRVPSQNCDEKVAEVIVFFCFQPLNLCDIEEVASVLVSKEDEISQKVDIELRDPEKEVRSRAVLNPNLQEL